MRYLFVVLTVGLSAAFLGAAQGGSTPVEVKGPHICCKQCINIVGSILGKVDGVSDVKADIKTRSVTFTARNDQSAQAGVKALIDGGFFGKASQGGKEIKVAVPAVKKGEKADVVTVSDVHVCCGQCQSAINKVFKSAKVTYEGKGAQRTVRIEGANLDRAEVIDALHQAGFHGKLQK
jgi:copper chaperone CopZ